jgi:Reverse transcriptase (RNA-dependent DNA polymerase)/zinc-binding in reverse transcriptase
MDLLNDFYDNKVDLWRINKSHITLIQKKPGATRIEDFQPISVLSAISKIITKLLAERLRLFLPELISLHQTAFINERRITETFILARQSLSFLHKHNIPSVLLKIDFKKAFDSISWDYLLQLIRRRKFPNRWISWIHNILISSSSSVKVNVILGQPFFHRRGLRQGDPLSPMLFILATETLQGMIATSQQVLFQIPGAPTKLLQFADDTVIFTPAHPQNLHIIMNILRQFVEVSGLHINLQKSGFLPISLSPQHAQTIASILQCQPFSLPLSYLGLPLTIKRPSINTFQPLVSTVQNRLQGWKGKPLSMAGRLVLLNAVINALLIYYMQVFLLPTSIIDQVTRITRIFLWRGHKTFSSGHCLVKWNALCLPKRFGGLDILDLKAQNMVLLLRWLWIFHIDPHTLWTQQLRLQLEITSFDELSNLSATTTFFTKDLSTLLPLFHACTTQTQSPLQLLWSKNNIGTFTSKSAYQFMINSGVHLRWPAIPWRLTIPPKVKLFIWLLLQDKLLTNENLAKRNWLGGSKCMLCDVTLLETSCHLFFFFMQLLTTSGRISCHTIIKFPIRLRWSLQSWILTTIRGSVLEHMKRAEPTHLSR